MKNEPKELRGLRYEPADIAPELCGLRAERIEENKNPQKPKQENVERRDLPSDQRNASLTPRRLDKVLQVCYKEGHKGSLMKPQELKEARLAKSWGQSKAAARLGMSQAYLNMLENGKRQLTPDLTRKFVLGYGLSPETLPVPKEFTPAVADGQYLAGALAKLGYPGFAFLRSPHQRRIPRKSCWWRWHKRDSTVELLKPCRGLH